MDYYLGIDFGTSGVRLIIINNERKIIKTIKTSIESPKQEQNQIYQDPNIWWSKLLKSFNDLKKDNFNFSQIKKICVDGTSGTILISDLNGNPLTKALMYNDASCLQQSDIIKNISNNNPLFSSPNNALARSLFLFEGNKFNSKIKLLHQADWIIGKLLGEYKYSDNNNSLKLGYDSKNNKWFDWIDELPFNRDVFPIIKDPGDELGNLSQKLVNDFGFDKKCKVSAGTTDGIASFLSTGASKIGESVTSLGTTMVIKSITKKPLFNSDYGIYSHKIGNLWLAGGASNVGGQILINLFKDDIESLSKNINTEKLTGYKYYPLLKAGERFPINNVKLEPKITPKPNDRNIFFQAILEGITFVEKNCYEKLSDLGGIYPEIIYSVGGGAHNNNWNILRGKILNSKIINSPNNEAAYGTALLAKGIEFS